METRPDQRVVPALGEDRRSRPGSTFDLMDSKLRSPPARPGIVARTALVERLLASPAPVICVVAPPGYGKTTLLAQWSGRLGTQVGWVSVDRRDNDPVVLLTYIAAALDRIEPVDPEVFQALASPGVSVAGTALPRVVAAVSTITRPVTLVLDHVELLENPECLDAVDELAMDAREARAPLEAADAAPSDAEAAKLIARTEGWPVGLYLAALARRAAGGRRSITGYRFSGDDRFIADYLHSELLARLPAELVSFLTRAAVLERMCGPLCDAVLDATGSGEVLASLEESNLLVVPLDRTALHRGDLVAARGQLARAARLRPLLTHAIPWLAVQTLLELGRAYLTLDDLAGPERSCARQATSCSCGPTSAPCPPRSSSCDQAWTRPAERSPEHRHSPPPSCACFPCWPPTSPFARSASGCTSRTTRSRPTPSPSTESSRPARVARRSSGHRRSASSPRSSQDPPRGARRVTATEAT